MFNVFYIITIIFTGHCSYRLNSNITLSNAVLWLLFSILEYSSLTNNIFYCHKHHIIIVFKLCPEIILQYNETDKQYVYMLFNSHTNVNEEFDSHYIIASKFVGVCARIFLEILSR